MRRTNTAAQLFELAVKTEEERIAEARTKAELKAHPHSLTKTPSQEYGDKKVIQDPVGPKKVSSETRSRKLSDAKSARKEEERRERISEGSDDWWEGETLPDDDWEFVEWPPMSGLIWKSSGLDRLVLGLGGAED
ncbi:hypothetical protein NpPPO83_00006299 [Neofusicoccum parvum]|uniref:Uncharacterized protein n=1 Tax=Neofusicoccum parvum TaxID=310453 RepID=A0ACB5RSJ5_9PEZI|nr:hypothetical protein NpPPO83_00006299 [Neofusicoccum parvum]